MWNIDFITEEEFDAHVAGTIRSYADSLTSFDIQKFNSNLVDPIKLIFDKSVYGLSWDEIIKSEIFRQRDKSNNNSIGFFHQKIFYYLDDCDVPQQGWDVIFRTDGDVDLGEGIHASTAYVEIKNKHNTMNSASAAKTYIRMQDQLLNDDDCVCLLVEAIARHSQNITWSISIDGQKKGHNRIRRVSIDKFYELVTGDPDAFYKICSALPESIERVLKMKDEVSPPHDTVIEELKVQAKSMGGSMSLALYMLGFSGYQGFPGG